MKPFVVVGLEGEKRGWVSPLGSSSKSPDCHTQEFGSVALPRPAAGSSCYSMKGPARPFRKHSMFCALSHAPSWRQRLSWCSSIKCWGLSEAAVYVCPVFPLVWAEHREMDCDWVGLLITILHHPRKCELGWAPSILATSQQLPTRALSLLMGPESQKQSIIYRHKLSCFWSWNPKNQANEKTPCQDVILSYK